ncbi:hypothetical protein [Lentibacillus sp. CBA3610]|uniref:hypothetical protein n=1 Tax=Lentibacillus sp. CBA3610 TaxID=2518176 RepID=UPI0015958D72|nr:hypothetical protein [Lentibacillus sp. CBA3610]QKY71270.1 hypothetical protein Len3610_18470 [Lentibacillus sp. CBA3610]
MTFEIRDGKGIVYNTVENPAAVFDSTTGTLHKIGNREAMLGYFNYMNETYRKNGFHDMADELQYMELPKNQREIDRVFQMTGYIKRLYDKTFPVAH